MISSLVINGELTLGAMVAIQYIIGQLSGPVEQFVIFVQSAQNAKLSMERLNEIHQLKEEEVADNNLITQLGKDKSIRIANLSYSYMGAGSEPVLKNISMEILQGKVIAIVGMSGSGKTTLMKLLLKFYDNYIGDIKVGELDFKSISPSFWRKQCGAVLQDGYIFNDSIARNIAVGEDAIDYQKLKQCCEIANILTFIESLPNGFETHIGAEGSGISNGQRQRILIARSIYKEPQYLFFDEATNELDAFNEKLIVENLQKYYKDKTVIIIAHRLSTVKSADQIIVLNEGQIVEEGNHLILSQKKGRYFNLIKNQLELES